MYLSLITEDLSKLIKDIAQNVASLLGAALGLTEENASETKNLKIAPNQMEWRKNIHILLLIGSII